MVTLTLPSLVAGRDLADEAVSKLGSLHGADVVVDARDLVSGTPSFAAQLVQRVLSEEDAASLTLIGAPSDFAGYASQAAEKLNTTSRLRIRHDDPGS